MNGLGCLFRPTTTATLMLDGAGKKTMSVAISGGTGTCNAKNGGLPCAKKSIAHIGTQASTFKNQMYQTKAAPCRLLR